MSHIKHIRSGFIKHLYIYFINKHHSMSVNIYVSASDLKGQSCRRHRISKFLIGLRRIYGIARSPMLSVHVKIRAVQLRDMAKKTPIEITHLWAAHTCAVSELIAETDDMNL